MNIFVTSPNPDECARALDDKRLVCQCKETKQILSAAVVAYGGAKELFVEPALLAQPMWPNHPVTRWVARERCNWQWTIWLMHNLCAEFERRYKHQHEAQRSILNNLRPIGEPRAQVLIAQVHAMRNPERFCNCSYYKDNPDTFAAYKQTLNDKWHAGKHPPRWAGDRWEQPAWANFTWHGDQGAVGVVHDLYGGAI